MPIDPRINCAAEICCSPEQARLARIGLLCDLGCPKELAPKMADAMEAAGLVFMPAELAKVMSEIVDHPGAGKG